MVNDDKEKQRLAKTVKFVLIGLFCAIAAPLAWLAVTGLAGMLAFMGIFAAGAALSPVIALRLANFKYRALDAERVSHVVKVCAAASENPIETIQLSYNGRVKDAAKFAISITEFRTEIKNYEGTVKEFEFEYPDEAITGHAQLTFMRTNLKDREDRYGVVQLELANLAALIRKMQALWKLAMATQRMNQLSGMNTEDEFAHIKNDAAVDSVMSNLNKAFAQMETASMVSRYTPQPIVRYNQGLDTVQKVIN